MKKLVALVMMLCMLCAVAFAEDGSAITWAEIEPQLAENGLSGDFVVFEQLGLKIWLPTGLNAVEVSEEDAAAGRLALFMTDDQSAYLAVDAANVEGLTIDQLFENAQANADLSDAEMINTNGLTAVVYKSNTSDFWSASLVDSNSNIINFVMGPASADGTDMVFKFIMASLQPAA